MKNNGFSLIEASIALIIIGLLMTPIMAEYNRETKQQKIDISQANNQAVKFAVEQFFRDKGRYPCPADPTKKVGDLNFGKEICPPVSAASGKCTTGVCVANAVGGGFGRVLYGAVPFTDLKMDFTKAMDGWSHKISFAVAEPLTTNPAGSSTGNIVIETIDKDTDNVIPLTGVGHFLVISSGENGKGSFNADGNMVTSDAKFDIGTGELLQPCEEDIDYDAKNCDNDGLFMIASAGSRALGQERYFDDIATSRDSPLSDLWLGGTTTKDTYTQKVIAINTLEPGVELDSSGAVVIDGGTGLPKMYTSSIPLDVNGKIRASSALSGSMCDVSGDNCFSSEVLAGSGYIDCSDNGEALSGISNGGGDCASGIQMSGTGGCPAGEVATGINAGVIQCAAP